MMNYLVESTFRCSSCAPRPQRSAEEAADGVRGRCQMTDGLLVFLAPDFQRYRSSSPRKIPPLKAQGRRCHFGGGRRDPCDRSEEGGVSAGRAGPVKSHAGRVRTLRAPLRATGRPRRVAASPQVKWRSVATGSGAESARSYCP